MTVAALYVDPAGIYSTLPDVECWGLPDRDAREYGGPHPVVAHPPCAMWGAIAQAFRREMLGQDGGCFEAALAAVQEFGGVLEHPAGSAAWRKYGLPLPTRWFWQPAQGGTGWATKVWQGTYGHLSPKPTYLFYAGERPPLPARWEQIDPGGRMRHVTGCSHPDRKKIRESTPPAFAEYLVQLARHAHP